MKEPLESAELLAFTKIVDTRSVSRAALELRVPRATVGRRLARLEERLGVRLLRRSTRALVLSEAGEALYRHARIALDAVHQAEASVQRTDSAVRGELRVSVPPIQNPTFYALIDDFLHTYPEVRLQLHFSSRQVDLSRAGYDIALRGSAELEPGLVARSLGRTRLIAVASPAYLERHGPLRSARDLRHHQCLVGFARGELPTLHWIDGKGRRVQIAGRLSANDISFLAQAALDGLGVAFLPYAQVRPALEAGLLVHVLKDSFESETRMAVVYLEREFVAPAVRAFADAICAWAKREGESALWPQLTLPPRAAQVTQGAARSKSRKTRAKG